MEKQCLVICPFGRPNSDIRKRSDMLLEYVIKKAVEKYGYSVYRADLDAQPGIVTIHVIQHLIEDALVIADITNRNPNVFYELAIRHAIRKPFIQLISEGEEIPFNIQEIQTIKYDVQDIASHKRTIETIEKQIIYYESGGKVTSPITVAIDGIIGTRSLEQFKHMIDKLTELDNSILEAKEIQSSIDEFKESMTSLEVNILSRIESSLSKSNSSKETSSKQENSKPINEVNNSPFPGLNKRSTPNTFSIGEWLDRENERRRK